VLTIDAGLLSDTAIQRTHIIVLEFCFDMLRYSMKRRRRNLLWIMLCNVKLSIDYMWEV
jgi:hypothetical protein